MKRKASPTNSSRSGSARFTGHPTVPDFSAANLPSLSRQHLLYQAGAESEQQTVAKLVAVPFAEVAAHVHKIMELANSEAERTPDRADFWLGVNDVAWMFYSIRRRTHRREGTQE